MLEDICEAGITVVTLDDGRKYTLEIMDQDPTALIVALLVAARANEESEKKARRLSASWENKRKHARDRPLTAACPAWLVLREDRTGFEVDETRAEIVRKIFADTLEGKGQHAIANDLNKRSVPVFGRGKMWHRSYVSKLLGSQSVTGTYVPHKTERVTGKKTRVPLEPVPDYYPAVIDDETFSRVAALATGRGAGSGPKGVSSILAGLAKCPLCRSTMTRVSKGKNGGRPYLVCTVAKAGGGCRYKQVRIDYLEEAFLDKIKELERQLPAADADMNDRWEELLRDTRDRTFEIENVLRAVEETGHSKALLGRLAKLERMQEETQNEISELAGRIGDALTKRTKQTVTELVEQCTLNPPNIRRINAIMRQLFTSVEVDFLRGELWFHWKHSDDQSKIIYSLPEHALTA